MSEFSESYHLEADDQQDGLHLLQRANLEGFVFPPQHGWVTIIPRSEFGAPPQSLLEANEGCLLRYLLDQDAGWMFQLYTGPILACSYECRWLDWRAWQSRITVDASGVDVELVWTLAQRHGHDSRLLELERILRPRIVRRSSKERGQHYDDFVDWPAGETLDNVAYAFARLLGLSHYQWLQWRDDLSEERNGSSKVQSRLGTDGARPLP
jgi:hypothetical protein